MPVAPKRHRDTEQEKACRQIAFRQTFSCSMFEPLPFPAVHQLEPGSENNERNNQKVAEHVLLDRSPDDVQRPCPGHDGAAETAESPKIREGSHDPDIDG